MARFQKLIPDTVNKIESAMSVCLKKTMALASRALWQMTITSATLEAEAGGEQLQVHTVVQADIKTNPVRSMEPDTVSR